MPINGRGRIVIWEGASLWILEAEGGFAQTDYHAHHAIQITLALEGAFELRTAHERLSDQAVAVAPNASHIFQADGLVAFLFIEPESAAGQAIMAAAFRENRLAALQSPTTTKHLTALANCFRAGGKDDGLIRLGKQFVADLAGSDHAGAPDHRVQAMIAYADANLEESISLPSAASVACLSPSRARHLFVEQTGLPFKTYVLWLRINRAVGIYAAGATLTEAAHEAGFADSAHFSRTFRRTFGVSADSLRVNSRFIQAAAPEGS